MNKLYKISLITALMVPFVQAMELPEKSGKKAEKEEKIEVFHHDQYGMPYFGNRILTLENRTELKYRVKYVVLATIDGQDILSDIKHITLKPHESAKIPFGKDKKVNYEKGMVIKMTLEYPSRSLKKEEDKSQVISPLEETAFTFPTLKYLAQENIVITTTPDGDLKFLSQKSVLNEKQLKDLHEEVKNLEKENIEQEAKEFIVINKFKELGLLN